MTTRPATVAVAGMAIARQRPATANGVVFMLLEDEFGQVNLIVPPPVYERYRPLVRGEPLLLARGKLERVGPKSERARLDARVTRAAGARDRGRSRGAERPAAGPPFRTPLIGQPAAFLQHVGAGDEGQMGERLREVAEHPLRNRVVLLRNQAEVVAEADEPREELFRLVAAADQGEIRCEPERARQEDPLARREPVDLDVLLVGLVACDQTVPVERRGRLRRPFRSPAGRPAAGSRRAESAGRSRPVACDPYDWTNVPRSVS